MQAAGRTAEPREQGVPVVRFEPGAEAPRAGTYALTGEWGEPTGESACVAEGQRLPFIDTEEEPRWYVLVALAGEDEGGPWDAAPGALRARRLGEAVSPPRAIREKSVGASP